MTRCCDLHREPRCCDPADCGPCCADCPSCPTLRERRRATMPRAAVALGGVVVTVCERAAPERGLAGLAALLDDAKVNPAAVFFADDVVPLLEGAGRALGRQPGESWAPVS